VRDLPWGQFRTTVVIELYRVRCPTCGLKIEKVEQLSSKRLAPNASKRLGKGLRKCFGAACSHEVWRGREYRPSHRSTLSGTLA
jgi:uncharacterized protein with PIN domain